MLKDKIKKIFSKNFGKEPEDGDNKKKIENLAVFVVILIVTLIAINLIWSGGKKDNTEPSKDPNKKLASTDTTNGAITTSGNVQDTLSLQLEDILAQIEGVGKVKVLITYSQTNTEEQDKTRRNTKGNRNK